MASNSLGDSHSLVYSTVHGSQCPDPPPPTPRQYPNTAAVGMQVSKVHSLRPRDF
jgi:hypothetical protein